MTYIYRKCHWKANTFSIFRRTNCQSPGPEVHHSLSHIHIDKANKRDTHRGKVKERAII